MPPSKKDAKPEAPSSEFAQAFFSGKIRDKSTKESRKAAEDLAILKTKHKNPEWKPMNSKGCKVNVKGINVAKAVGKLADSMPRDRVNQLVEDVGGSSADAAASAQSHDRFRSPVRDEVRQEIIRRMQTLFDSGQTFEEGREYADNEKDAEDAKLIVQGIDPGLEEARRRGETFYASREIPIQRSHWVASMQGVISTAKFGSAYLHTSGALTMLRQGHWTQCRCGGLHTAM